MKITTTKLEGALVVEQVRRSDSRGSFARFFCDRELAEIMGHRKIVQINHSVTSKKGAVRGFHFQFAPDAEMKLIRCLRGMVWDVAVDLRQNSKTFLQWQAIELCAEKNNLFVIPEGFAHGFQTLTEDCEMLYLHTAHYAPHNESGVRWDDPLLKVKWPLDVTELSDRDRDRPKLENSFKGINL